MPKCKFPSADFLNTYLNNNEYILWDQIKLVNLTSKRIAITFIVVLIGILIGFNYLIAYFMRGIQAIIFSTTFSILFLSFVILYSIKITKNRKKELQLTKSELKNVVHFDTTTNLRYIRRNFYSDLDLYRSRYSIEGLVIQDKILFVSLNHVKNVVLDETYRKIVFILRHKKKISGNEHKHNQEDFEFLNIAFSPNDPTEWDHITSLIRKIIPEKKIE